MNAEQLRAAIERAIVDESFLAGTGPGGQNVNKVATNVQLRVNIFALGLTTHAYHKLKTLSGSRLNQAGEILIMARQHRSREANREDARARMLELLIKAHEKQARRVPTRASKSAQRRRVDEKKKRSSIKQGRGKQGHGRMDLD